jgi:hypothetical protein
MAVAAAAAVRIVERRAILYDVLLLHGTPVRRAERLPASLGEGDSVFVAGEEWTVAAVRDGSARPQLICLRGL